MTGIQTAITLYTLVMAACMITGGKLGQILGRKRAFAIGCVIYGCGSFTTAISPSLGVLVFGWSFLEGVGAALILPAIVALVASNFARPRESQGSPRGSGRNRRREREGASRRAALSAVGPGDHRASRRDRRLSNTDHAAGGGARGPSLRWAGHRGGAGGRAPDGHGTGAGAEVREPEPATEV